MAAKGENKERNMYTPSLAAMQPPLNIRLQMLLQDLWRAQPEIATERFHEGVLGRIFPARLDQALQRRFEIVGAFKGHRLHSIIIVPWAAQTRRQPVHGATVSR